MADNPTISPTANFIASTEEQTADSSHRSRVIPYPFGVRLESGILTRTAPLTQYAQGQIIGGAANGHITISGLPRNANSVGLLNCLQIWTNKKDCSWVLRAHLYNATPAAVADYGAFSYLFADVTKYQGFVDVTLNATIDQTSSDAAFGQWEGGKPFKMSATNTLIIVLEQRSFNALAPANAQQFQAVGFFG